MKVFLIKRVAKGEKSNALYIGKRSPTYGLTADQDLEKRHSLKPLSHWFTTRPKAKVWLNERAVKQFVNRYNKGKTHSFYEIEIDDNGKITRQPLDDFIASI